MSGGGTLEHIDAVDAFARTLFLRAKQYPGPSLPHVAAAVRQLHLALRHLRVEAADTDSLLHGATDSDHARQIQPIVEESDFALRRLQSLLDKHDAHSARHLHNMPERLAAVRSRLASQKAAIDLLLDAVQLHHPPHGPPDNATQRTEGGLEGIKDKVDKIAAKLFSRRDSTATIADEDRLWKEFKTELENEGFASDVLRRHKEVLRAYIRELESTSSLNGGSPPTVRGLLERQSKGLMPPAPSVDQRRSFSPDAAESGTGDPMALVSTKDLMAMDSVRAGMAGLRLHDPSRNGYATSPRSSQKYLAPDVAATQPLAAEAELSGSANSQLGSSPSFAPLMPSYGYPGQQPPPYGSSPRSAPSRLAPDSHGNEIALDAPWTKIKRSLVSPEALERARVRYEARPEYVAVLGRLTREQIAHLARQSVQLRAARTRKYTLSKMDGRRPRPRADSKSSREDDGEDAPWDDSDADDHEDDKTSERGTRSYPFIVSPPSKDKTSPASTVMPKPILKNKNENHVRFDPKPHEVDSRSGSFKDERDRQRDLDTRRHRHHRDGERSGRSRDRHRREGEGERRDGERERHDGEKRHDRHRCYDGDYRPHHRGERKRRGSRKDERPVKKKAWGQTLGAVGIGGAAASLLGVLAEAAVGT